MFLPEHEEIIIEVRKNPVLSYGYYECNFQRVLINLLEQTNVYFPIYVYIGYDELIKIYTTSSETVERLNKFNFSCEIHLFLMFLRVEFRVIL